MGTHGATFAETLMMHHATLSEGGLVVVSQPLQCFTGYNTSAIERSD